MKASEKHWFWEKINRRQAVVSLGDGPVKGEKERRRRMFRTQQKQKRKTYQQLLLPRIQSISETAQEKELSEEGALKLGTLSTE
jgi:hypothetical protein